MKTYDIPEDAVRLSTNDYSIQNRLKAEYVLKVDNTNTVKNASNYKPYKKSNPYSKALPIVREKHPGFLRKAIVMTMIFILFFLVSVIVSYNAIFYLFEV